MGKDLWNKSLWKQRPGKLTRTPRGVSASRTVPPVCMAARAGPQALQVNTKHVSAILRSATGHNTIFKVKTKDTEETAIVKDWLVDPVKGHLLHVDLLRIAPWTCACA